MRCYAELNDYVPEGSRQRDTAMPLCDAATVGQLIDGLGIPLFAIEVVLVNGVSRGLEHGLRAGDRVSLYPTFESFDVAPLVHLRLQPLRRPRFLADAHLGRLARYLRLLGFDTLFENDPGDVELVRISLRDGRILLSRDRGLLERRMLTHGLRIQSVSPREQLTYVVDRLDLYGLFRPFTRCTICNGSLSQVGREAVALSVPARVRSDFDTFWLCDGCGRVYWRGSHYDRLQSFVEQLLAGQAVRGEG